MTVTRTPHENTQRPHAGDEPYLPVEPPEAPLIPLPGPDDDPLLTFNNGNTGVVPPWITKPKG